MRIEKLNENKIKIIFNYKELEENNISVHSFLSNSPEYQKLFFAILDIANEDFGFDINNSQISYEALSYDNKNFVIFVTKLNNSDISNFSDTDIFYNKINNNEIKNNNCFNFIGNKLLDFNNTTYNSLLIYKFEKILELFKFCNFINKNFLTFNINSSLYKYNNIFFIKINIEKLDLKQKNTFISALSEFKTPTVLSNLSLVKLEEFSELLIKNNAIENL